MDLAEPTFSDPTRISNPLFRKTVGTQVIQLGAEGNEQLRFEVTTLPDTKIVRWNGQRNETRVDHFMAYGDGRILEVAVDFYAQADDGAVWYFGEDVYNYQRGVVHDGDGTWLAGKDGPPGMIMPGEPQIGDVYRPENIPGLVFEEVTVKGTDEPLDGPQGPITGLLIQERLMDGTLEDKVFAPGYGEFRAQVKTLDELYNLAVAVPQDRRGDRMPRQLTALWSGAIDVFDGAGSDSSRIDAMSRAWGAYRSSNLPPLLKAQMSAALQALDRAASHPGQPAMVRQAAIDAGQAVLDLQLQYGKPSDVDLDRLSLWARQLVLDADAGYAAGVSGDAATLRAIWDRIDSSVNRGTVNRVAGLLTEMQASIERSDLAGAAGIAAEVDRRLGIVS